MFCELVSRCTGLGAMESIAAIETILVQLANLPDRAIVVLIEGAAVELAKRMREADSSNVNNLEGGVVK